MEGIVINPDIDLSILSQEGFSKRFSELTGELLFYVDLENQIEIYLDGSIGIGYREFSSEREKQILKILKLYSKGIIKIKEEEGVN